ncbi:MAG: hypothetical protein N2322_00050 [Terrimicrobiaceae bacterium]|nr:hypothetical protein [Terrimicrobiaceae bacterium]
MPTYIYETIPSKAGARIKRYEIRQSITSPALEKHPETGEPIRRVIAGGAGIMSSKRSEPSTPPARASSGGHCCGGGCACAR